MTNKVGKLSVIGLLSGVGISLLGLQWSLTIYGCVPSAGVQCNPPAPPIIIYGEFLLGLGGIVFVASIVGLAYSFIHRSSKVIGD